MDRSRWQLRFNLAVYSLKLITLSLIYRIKAGYSFIGSEFDNYGRQIAWEFAKDKDWGRFLNLFCNPVGSIRYFEFPFTMTAVNWSNVQLCLDVSSPRLFFLYLLSKYPQLRFELINPDINDLQETELYLKKLRYTANLVAANAIELPYPDRYFEVITSISVIEHIPDHLADQSLQEIWRVLQPGGKLIITVPCQKSYTEEWRDTDPYNLGNTEEEGKYFFQRFYDFPALQSKLFDVLEVNPIKMQIWGEKVAGIFDGYIENWQEKGLSATLRDPYTIVEDYQYFEQLENLVHFGVCGLIFQKPN